MESENVVDNWDEGDEHDYYIDEQLDGEGSKFLVYKKKGNNMSANSCNTLYSSDIPPSMYLAWYLISHYIKPEDVGTFAKINRTTHSFTKTDHFWRNIYKVYCEGDFRLPDKLVLDNKCKIIEIRMKVIRALHYTYDHFIKKAVKEIQQTCKPQDLVNKKCVYISFDKKTICGQAVWYYLFKFKKESVFKRGQQQDTNSVENYQILQVTCGIQNNVPLIMNMYLTRVSSTASMFTEKHYSMVRLYFGTIPSPNAPRLQEDVLVQLLSLKRFTLLNWWHPHYRV